MAVVWTAEDNCERALPGSLGCLKTARYPSDMSGGVHKCLPIGRMVYPEKFG